MFSLQNVIHQTFLLISINFLFIGIGFAETGQDIAQKVYDRPSGQTQSIKAKVILLKNDQLIEERIMETYSQKYGEIARNSVIKFNEPSLIRGTALLLLKDDTGSERTFLYLPALGKERMVNGSQKHKRFADTEFTYEDLEDRVVNKDNHKRLADEAIDGKSFYVLESRPIDKEESQYSLRKSWIDKLSLLPLKIEYYDHKNSLIKVFLNLKQEKLQNFWTIVESEMSNLENGRKTKTSILETRYDLAIDQKKFNPHRMGDL